MIILSDKNCLELPQFSLYKENYCNNLKKEKILPLENLLELIFWICSPKNDFGYSIGNALSSVLWSYCSFGLALALSIRRACRVYRISPSSSASLAGSLGFDFGYHILVHFD